MAEEKIFKHPLGLTSAFGAPFKFVNEDVPPRYEIYTEASGHQEFPLDEWDIEVKFTRKPEPLKAGDQIKIPRGSYSPYTVLHIHDNRIWLMDRDGDDDIWDLDDLDYTKI